MKALRPLISALTVGCLCACGDNQDPEGAQELLDRIRALDYTATFAKAPGYETRRPSNTAHSEFSDIFVNPVVQNAIDEGATLTEWPLDSLIVKDGYDGSELSLIAVMEKREGGWYWAEYLDPDEADGGVKFSGHPAVCIDCHAIARESDYTRAFALP